MKQKIGLWIAAAGMLVAALIGLAVGRALPRADSGSARDIARNYIVAHPDVMAEAVDRLRIGSDRAQIEKPFASAWAGNPRGDVTLVMFTDYNCPYCKASAGQIDRLMQADPNLKVVWRELPVLGPESDSAAQAALAAAGQGKYLAFHRALFAGNRPDTTSIAAAARTAGLDPARLATQSKAPEVAAEVTSNLALARRMRIDGTPFFVIGDRTYQGAIGYDGLAEAIAEARKQAS